MKRYQFRLAAVLRLRRMEEERCREALLAANRRLHEASEARDLQAARYAALCAAAPGATLPALLAERQAGELAAQAVHQAATAATLAAERRAQVQESWVVAQRSVRVLERLEERRCEEHAADERRAEATSVDELVTARYIAASRSARRSGGHR